MTNIVKNAVSSTMNQTDYMDGIGEQGTGLGAAPIARNSAYQALYNANPYRNLTYNRSGWQALISALGFRTDYDRWKEEAQVNAAEYDAQIASIIQQNEYNSPTEQANRMRQAGMNPDLVGTSGVEPSATPQQDVNGMSPNLGDEATAAMGKVMDFASGVLGLFQVGSGLAKDMLTFRQMSNAMDSEDINLAKQFMGFANDIVLQNAPASPFETNEQYQEHVGRINNILYGIPDVMKFSRRQRKIWNGTISRNYFNSPDFQRMTEGWLKNAENMDKLSKLPNYIRFSNNAEKDDFADFNIVSKHLSKLADDVWVMTQKNLKNIAEAGDAKASYDKDFYNTLNGADAARAENAKARNTQAYEIAMNPVKKAQAENDTYELTSMSTQIEKAMNQTIHKITSDLSKRANNGDNFAAALLLAFNVFRLSNVKIF